MENIIIIVIMGIIIGLAGGYVYKAKKNGQKCIGCPHAKSCNTKKQNKTSCGENCGSCDGGCGHN